MCDRAAAITTRRQALRSLAGQTSARLLALVSVALLVAVVLVSLPAPPSGRNGIVAASLAAVGMVVVLVGPVEWFVHRYLLHASEWSLPRRRLGTGVAHTEHHRDPDDLRWLFLSGIDVAAMVLAFGALCSGWALPLGLLADPGGGTPSGTWLVPWLAAWSAATFALLHYEWVHLLVHTRYRPRSGYYRRLVANHRRHHHRNPQRWLGVTSTLGDRLFGTS